MVSHGAQTFVRGLEERIWCHEAHPLTDYILAFACPGCCCCDHITEHALTITRRFKCLFHPSGKEPAFWSLRCGSGVQEKTVTQPRSQDSVVLVQCEVGLCDDCTHSPFSMLRNVAHAFQGGMTFCYHCPRKGLNHYLKIQSLRFYYSPAQPASAFLCFILKVILGFQRLFFRQLAPSGMFQERKTK